MANAESGTSSEGERTFSIPCAGDQLTFALHQVNSPEMLLRVSLLLHKNEAISRGDIAAFLRLVGKEALGIDLEEPLPRRTSG